MAADLPKFAVSDNAANMKKGISSSLFDLYLCCCHTQQLAVLDTFKEFHGDSLGVTLLSASNTCKRLAAHLHKSNIGKLLLEEEFPKAMKPDGTAGTPTWRASSIIKIAYFASLGKGNSK